MDFQELLFADAVLSRAGSIKQGAYGKYVDQCNNDGQEPDSRQQWSKDAPIRNFIPQALKQLEDVAAQIRELSQNP